MFDLTVCFGILFSRSANSAHSASGWKNRKAVSEDIAKLFSPNALSKMPQTFFNKFFLGDNKGSTLYAEVQEEIDATSFSSFIHRMTKELASLNYADRKFSQKEVSQEIYTKIQNSTNLTGNIRQGLLNSYHLNQGTNPYLFLAEALYYAFNAQTGKELQYTQITPLPKVSQEVELTQNISIRLAEILRTMNDEEKQVFATLASLVITDEDEQPYLYAPVSEEEIALYTSFGINNQDWLLMEECGFINLGARIDNIMELGEDICGFYNDNLVLAMTAKDDKSPVFQYKSYSFTTSGIEYLEILDKDTNDDFFMSLAKIISKQIDTDEIRMGVFEVEDVENLEL